MACPDRYLLCIVMRRWVWAFGLRWPGRVDTPEASCCACSPVTPSSSWSPPPPTARPVQPVTAVHPQLAGLRPGVRRDRTGDPGRRGPGLPGPAARAVRGAGRGAARPVKVVDLGADHRLRDAERLVALLRRRARRRLDLRAARAARPAGRRSPRATRVANTGCYAVATTLALAPLIAAGAVAADDVVVVAASGTSGAGPGRQGPPARQRGDGRPVALQGRRAPARAGDQAGHRRDRRCRSRRCSRRCRGASWPPSPPCPPATPIRRAVLAAAYADEPFVHVLPEGAWPHTAATAGLELLPPPGHRGRRLRPGDRGQRHRQPRQGRGRRRPCRTPT